MMIPDDRLIKKLKADDRFAFLYVYKFYFPPIAVFICKNGGTNHDAEDVFQETMIVLMKNINKKDFVLYSSLKTYVYSISKNIWLKKIREARRMKLVLSENHMFENDHFEIEIRPEATVDEMVRRWFTKITINCQRILKAIFYENEPMEVLMRKLGWKNRHTASNQQYKCIQQIKNEKLKEEKLSAII
jgi:RNA polymerase sigma factor (sigma-70 family)